MTNRITTVVALATFFCTSNEVLADELLGYINEDKRIVIAGENVRIIGIDFISIGGFLVPIPPGDLTASADPFEFLLANNPTQVTYGTFRSSIVVGEDTVLSVGYDAPPGILVSEDLIGQCNSGRDPCLVRFVPEPSSAVLALFAIFALLTRPKAFTTTFSLLVIITGTTRAQAQVCGLVESGQEIVVVSLDLERATRGLELASSGGYLIPIPPGDLTASPDPFDLLFANDETFVSRAMLPGSGRRVILNEEGFATGVFYAAPPDVDPAIDFRGNWAGGEIVGFRACVIPEPSSFTLLGLAAIGLLMNRQLRRKNAFCQSR